MGGIVSSLLGALKTARSVMRVLWDLSTEYSQLLDRANAPPSLPVPNPTTAYWQQDPPFPDLVNIRSEKLPGTADVVVIGSGITGVAIARTILHESHRTGQKRRVVVCEARTLCSGATGRNGGHIKASPSEIFGRFRKSMSPENAAALTRFQLRHLETLVELCRVEGIETAQCREVETVDLFLDQDSLDKAIKEVKDLKQWVPEFTISTWTAEEAREKFSANNQVRGAISYKAGALWPYRFVTSLWKSLLDEFPDSLSIETSTPVNDIHVSPYDPSNSTTPYTVSTPRGPIQTKHIVHATNGYTARLVPGLRGKVTSILAQMSSQSPGVNFPNLDGHRSWSIMYGPGFDYITQLPTRPDAIPGKIMLGGGFILSLKQGMDMIGSYDDSQMDALTNAHNLGIMSTVFGPDHWGPPVDQEPDMVWSGVIGLAGDLRPLVGRLDEQLTGRVVKSSARASSDQDHGEWIAAFFTGDGMVWAWLAGTGLGLMITGSQEEDLPAAPGRPAGKLGDWFPEELLPTSKRVKKMDIADLSDEFM